MKTVSTDIYQRICISELIMMDEDFGFDDTVGKEELEVDHILLHTKITAKIAFSEVRSIISFMWKYKILYQSNSLQKVFCQQNQVFSLSLIVNDLINMNMFCYLLSEENKMNSVYDTPIRKCRFPLILLCSTVTIS